MAQYRWQQDWTGKMSGDNRCTQIQHNTQVHRFELQLDNLYGCIAIQGVLKVNQTLTSIDLKNNNVKDLGFVALMDALKTNNTITDLDLRRNNITGEA